MKDITRYANDRLKPLFYNNIQRILPQLNFVRDKNRYISPLHVDGTEGTGQRKDRCVITEKYPTKVFDNSRQEAKDVITLFMEFNNIENTWEAINKLCDIVGIPQPEYTPEAKEIYRKMEERRNALESSAERQKHALFTPEGKEVLDYLLSRGWTKDEIEEAELGYISEAEATTINAQRSIGNFYKLSIPLRSGSTLYGFKFRTIEKEIGDRDKYTYLYGTEKRYNLFNLTGIKQKDGAVTVVESELDALHAQIRGIKGIVATGGGQLTEELLEAVLGRGIKRITLLFDKDESGAKFVESSINTAHKKLISVLVSTFPDGEEFAEGKPIHDVDEYLLKHSPEELQELIDNAIYGSKYLLETLVKNFTKEHGDGDLTDSQENELRNKVISLANHTPNEVERDLVLANYCSYFRVDGNKAFSKEALKAVADREREIEDTLSQKNQTQKAIAEITELAKNGYIQESLRRMKEVSEELSRIDKKAKYSELLSLPTEEDFWNRQRNKPEDLPTKYIVSNGIDTEVFTLPIGALTIIGAATSHGKSTLLQNITLQVAELPEDGTILYFSYEEDGDSIVIQMMNKYINTELCRNLSRNYSNNMRAIRHYANTGEDKYIATEVRELFHRKKDEFMRTYYTSGKIRIYYKDYDSAELVDAINVICGETKVKAVFIDYIQLIYNREYGSKLSRTEELKRISIDLKNVAVKNNIPIIAAAQLNREVTSPLDLFSQKTAESSEIERSANKMLLIWNTAFTAQGKDGGKELGELEKRHNFMLGEGGKIFAKLTKNRGGVVGLESALDFNGNIGVVMGNLPEEDNSETEENRDTTKMFFPNL